jgi:hypothetical protein
MAMNDKPSIIQYPTGRWGFVGLVPAELAYTQQNGQTPTPNQLELASLRGPGIVGLRPMTWETREAAEGALGDYTRSLYEGRPLDL